MTWWGRRNEGDGDDLPASTFDGSEATPSPYTDPDRQLGRSDDRHLHDAADPSRLGNRRYQRRLGLAAVLLFAVDAVVAYALGAPWFGLGCLLIGVAVYCAVRFLRIPLIALWAAIVLVFLFVLPLDGVVGPSATAQAPACPWMDASEAAAVLGHAANADAPQGLSHCSWSTPARRAAPGPRRDRLSLVVTDPTVAPSPTAADTIVPTVGLRAWTTSACTSSTCTEQLSVVLTSTFLTIGVTSSGVDPAQWEQRRPELARRITHLGSVVAPRISPPDR